MKHSSLLFSCYLQTRRKRCSAQPGSKAPSSLFPELISNREEVCGPICLGLAQKMLLFALLLLPLPLAVKCFLRFICKPVNTE